MHHLVLCQEACRDRMSWNMKAHTRVGEPLARMILAGLVALCSQRFLGPWQVDFAIGLGVYSFLLKRRMFTPFLYNAVHYEALDQYANYLLCQEEGGEKREKELKFWFRLYYDGPFYSLFLGS